LGCTPPIKKKKTHLPSRFLEYETQYPVYLIEVYSISLENSIPNKNRLAKVRWRAARFQDLSRKVVILTPSFNG